MAEIRANSIDGIVEQIQDESQRQNAQAILRHNLGEGIKGRKVKVVNEGTTKTEQQKQASESLIMSAPQLESIIDEYRKNIGNGYEVSFGYDANRNRLTIYTTLKGVEGVGLKPLTIELEDLSGNVGGRASSGRQIMVATHGENGRVMATTAGTKGMMDVVSALKNQRSNYHRALRAAEEAARRGHAARARYFAGIASGSASYRMKKATQAARPGENNVGGVSHLYKTENPETQRQTEQTLSYSEIIDSFFASPGVAALMKEANITRKELARIVKTNMEAGHSGVKGVPAAIAKDKRFLQLVDDLREISAAGVSIGTLNDEAYGHGYVRMAPNADARGYAGGRGRVQGGNYGRISQRAQEARGASVKKNPYNKEYWVYNAPTSEARKMGYKQATPEGGIAITEQMAQEMEREVSVQDKISKNEVERARKRAAEKAQRAFRKTGLFSYLGERAKEKTSLDEISEKDLQDIQERIVRNVELGEKEKRKLLKQLDNISYHKKVYDLTKDREKFAKEYVYSRISNTKLDPSRSSSSYGGFGFQEEDELYRGVLTYAEKFLSGDKLVGDLVRAAAEILSDKVFAKARNKTGVDVNAIQVADGALKTRKMSDTVFGMGETLLSFLSETGKGDAQKAIEGTPLAKLYSYDAEIGKWFADPKKLQTLQQADGGIEKFIRELLDFFSNVDKSLDSFVNKFGDVSKAARETIKYIVGNMEKTIDEEGNPLYHLRTGFLSRSRVNPMQSFMYGDPESTNPHLSRTVTQGVVANIRGSGVSSESARLLEKEFSVTKEQVDLQRQQQEKLQNLVAQIGEGNDQLDSKKTKDQYGASGGRITVGWGSSFDIDLSQLGLDFQDIEWEDGAISEETFNSSALKIVQDKVKEIVAKALGKEVGALTDEDVSRFRVFLNTVQDEAHAFDKVQYENQGANGSAATVSMRAVPLMLSGVGDVRKLSQTDISLLGLLNQVVGYNSVASSSDLTQEEKEAMEIASGRIASSVGGYIASVYNPVYDQKNEEYKASHEVFPEGGGMWGQNVPGIINGQGAADVYISPEMLRGLLERRFSNKNDLGAFQSFYEAITGKSGDFKNLASGFESLIKFLSDKRNQGLLGTVSRYPASTGNDQRFVNFKVDSSLQGKSIRLSRGLSALLNGDFDGDRILAMLTGLFSDKDGDYSALKKLYSGDDRIKLQETTIRAAQALEQRMAADELASDGLKIEESAIKAWSTPFVAKANEIITGVLKSETGALSNTYQAFADYAAKEGLDESVLTDSSSSEERLRAARSIGGRYILSETTQQAISAKKFGDRLLALGEDKVKALSPEQLQELVSTSVIEAGKEVDAIMSELKDEAFYVNTDEGKEKRKKFIEQLGGLGVVDEKTGRFNAARIEEQLMASLYNIAGNSKDEQAKFFSELFGTNVDASMLDTWDRKTKKLTIASENRFLPTVEQLLEAFAKLDSAGSVRIGNILSAGRETSTADRENAFMRLWFTPEVTQAFKSAFEWNTDKKDGSGQYNIKADHITITANSVTVNGGGGAGGSDGFSHGGNSGIDGKKAIRVKNLQLGEWLPYGSIDRASKLSLDRVGKTYGDNRLNRIKQDLAEVQGDMSKLRNRAYYKTEEGRAAIRSYQIGATATRRGTMAHALMEEGERLRKLGEDQGFGEKFDFVNYYRRFIKQGDLIKERDKVEEELSRLGLVAAEGEDPKTAERRKRLLSRRDNLIKEIEDFSRLDTEIRTKDKEGELNKSLVRITEMFNKFNDDFSRIFNKTEFKESVEGILVGAQELSKIRSGEHWRTTATEQLMGFRNPKTGDLVTGRVDFIGTRDVDQYDSEGNKVGTNVEGVIRDYKLLGKDKIGPEYATQLLYYQLQARQMLANFKELGITESTTADDLNAIIKQGDKQDKRYRILSQLGFSYHSDLERREGETDEELEARKSEHLIGNSLLTVLKDLFFSYGGDANEAVKHLRGEIAASTPNGVRVESISLANSPAQIITEMFEKGIISAESVEYLTKHMNAFSRNDYPHSGRGGKSGRRGRGSGVSNKETETKPSQYEIDWDAEGGKTAPSKRKHGEGTDLSEIRIWLNNIIKATQAIEEFEIRIKNLRARGGEDDLAAADRLEKLKEEQEKWRDVSKEQYSTAYSELTKDSQAEIQQERRYKLSELEAKRPEREHKLQESEDKSLLLEYNKLMNERVVLEGKITANVQKRSTSFYSLEKLALDGLTDEEKQRLAVIMQQAKEIEDNLRSRGREKDVDLINQDYQQKTKERQLEMLTRGHGARNIWDVLSQDIQRSFAMIFDYGLAYRAINGIRTAFQGVIQDTKELDAALTNIRIVTGDTRENTEDLMKTYNSLAKELGATTVSIAEASNEWLRQGYTVTEVSDLIEASTYLSKLGMIDSSQATEYLTSALKGFKLEASEAMDIVSKLTALDMDYAASAGDIAEGLSRTATTAQMAGMTLDEAAAAITTIVDVSQKSASSVGESLKTLLSRFGNVKAGSFVDLETGETDESLNDTEKVLNSIGISIRNSSMEFRSFSDVLDDLSEKWVNLSSVEQNAVSTAMAGTRQRENFNILMENYDSYKEAIETSAESAGTAEEKYEAYTDSIEYQVQRLAAAWEGLAQKVAASPLIKTLTGWAADLIEYLPVIIRYFTTLITAINSYRIPTFLKNIAGAFITPSYFGGKGMSSVFTAAGQAQRAASRGEEYNALRGYVPGEGNNGAFSSLLQENKTGNSIATKSNQELSTIRGLSAKIVSKLGGKVTAREAAGSSGGAGETVAAPGVASAFGGHITQQQANAATYAWGVAAKGTGSFFGAQARLKQDNVSPEEQSEINDALFYYRNGTDALARQEAEKAKQKFIAAGKEPSPEFLEKAQEYYNKKLGKIYQERYAPYLSVFAAQDQDNINRGKLIYKGKKYRWNRDTQKYRLKGTNVDLDLDADTTAALDQARVNREAMARQKKIGAVSTALMSGVSTAATVEGEGWEKGVRGLLSGGLAGIGQAIGGPIGGIIGQVVGDGLGELMSFLVHRDENARKERVEAAQEQLEALTELRSSVEGVQSAVKDIENFTSDDYKSLQSEILEITKLMKDNPDLRNNFLEYVRKFQGTLDLSDKSYNDLLSLISAGTAKERDVILKALSVAQYEDAAGATMAAQEQERYDIQSEFDKAAIIQYSQNVPDAFSDGYVVEEGIYDKVWDEFLKLEGADTIDTGTGDYVELQLRMEGDTTEEQLENLRNAKIAFEEKAIQADLDNEEDLQKEYERWIGILDENITKIENGMASLASLNDEVDAERIAQAFAGTVGSWDAVKIANSSLEEAINYMATQLYLTSDRTYEANGEITEEARRKIESFLRTQDNFSSLFEEDDAPLRLLLRNQDRRNKFIEDVSKGAGTVYSYEDIREAFDKNDEEAQNKILDAYNKDRAIKVDIDWLREQVYALDPSRLKNFADALGISVEEVEKLKGQLGNVSLGDLLGDPSDTITEITDKISLLSDYMEKGALSAENYYSVLEKYPELFYQIDEATGQIVGLGMQNYVSNLLKDIYGEGGRLGSVLGFQTYESLKQNTGLYSAYKELVEERYGSSKDLDFLENFNSFSDDFLAIINKDEELWSAYSETIQNMGGEISEYREAIEGLMDYQNTVYQQQIDNLESIKDGLDAINETREKELELIKAKDKLENAKKEKSLVYRAGIGWTFESNQTDIKEAKEELDNLETERKQEDIQYSINQLTKLQEFLKAIPNSEALSAQKEVYNEWISLITKNNEEQKALLQDNSAILGQFSEAYDKIAAIGERLAEYVSTDENAMSSSQKAAETLLDSENYDSGGQYAVTTAKENVDKIASENEYAEPYLEAAAEYNQALEAWKSNLQATGISDVAAYNTYAEAKQAVPEFTALDYLETSEQKEAAFASLKAQWEEAKKATELNDSVAKVTMGNGFQYKVYMDELATSEQLTTIGMGYKTDVSGKKDSVSVMKPEENNFTELDSDKGKGTTWEYAPEKLDELQKGTLLKFIQGNTGGAVYAYKINDVQWAKAAVARKGMISTPGGPMLINEEGIEGIITPSGTMTALPARSGVVPADLTKNLFVLGKVAPNLIKELESVSTNNQSRTSNSSNNYDNSTNISNLYASFTATENFDFDSLLKEIRGVVNTTRHQT